MAKALKEDCFYRCPQCEVVQAPHEMVNVHYMGASDVEHYACNECGCIITEADLEYERHLDNEDDI